MGNSCYCVYVPHCCSSLILDVYFYPLVFLFNFIKLSLSKISFLHSLKVKIIFCVLLSTVLLWDVCRLRPTPEKFSRLLKTFDIRQQRGQEFPRASCVGSTGLGPLTTIILCSSCILRCGSKTQTQGSVPASALNPQAVVLSPGLGSPGL